MLAKVYVTVISCILYGLVASSIVFFSADTIYREGWSLLGFTIMIIVYSSPFFLIIGIPFSYLIDYLFHNKKINYLFFSLTYAVSGALTGGIVFLFFKDHYSLLKIIAYFVTASITLSIAIY